MQDTGRALATRRRSRRAAASFALLLLGSGGLGACVPLAVGAGGTAGYVTLQERPAREAANDTAIHAQVSDALFREDHVLYGRVGVDVIEGRVMLTGVVPSEADRQLAERLARQADGVREVINEIQVGSYSGAGDWSHDAWITTQLRTRLTTDLDVSAINYSIETVNGVVYLLGIAQDEAELRRVTDHARRVPGVRRVVSHVRLKTDPRRPAV
jgi:osmotically-inducible protein OsmY